MNSFKSAPVRATTSCTLNSDIARAAAIAALRDLYEFDEQLSDKGVVQAARLHHEVSRHPSRSVGPLLAIIDMCAEPPLGDYPADYEAAALARMERR